MPDAGPLEPVSFTDDTSLPYCGAKVSIHAQILPGQPLDWFHIVRLRVPEQVGELKSTSAVGVFFALIPEGSTYGLGYPKNGPYSHHRPAALHPQC